MSKQHFETAAAEIKLMRQNGYNVEADACETFAVRLFQRYNARFDAARFRAACQP